MKFTALVNSWPLMKISHQSLSNCTYFYSKHTIPHVSFLSSAFKPLEPFHTYLPFNLSPFPSPLSRYSFLQKSRILLVYYNQLSSGPCVSHTSTSFVSFFFHKVLQLSGSSLNGDVFSVHISDQNLSCTPHKRQQIWPQLEQILSSFINR